MLFFDLFSRAPTLIKIAAGEPLFREGEAGETMYVLIGGLAQISIRGRMVEVIRAGDIVGEMSIVSPGPRSATVTATEPCEFVEVNTDRFNRLVGQTPEFALNVMRVLADRLRRADLA